ncbi:MAG: CsgG/HfaB family protein [Desulfuromonadaceae bacterium]
MKLRRYLPWTVLAVIFWVLCGCATTPHYTSEAVGIGYVKRIVILPFENNSGTKFAEERFRDVIATEILSRGLFDIVEKGEAQRFLREELVRKEQENLDLATANRLGEDLGVEAYLAGAVEEFEEKQNGAYTYPLVSVTLRMVDVKTGQIIWQASGSESGYSTLDRMFGFVSDDANTVSFRLAGRLLATLKE